MSFNKLFFLILISPVLCHAQILDHLSESKGDEPIIIEAENSVVCDEIVNKCVATGNASAKKGMNTVYGDVLTVFFTEGKERDITVMTADGHVRMETPTDKAYGDHAHYDAALDRILMTGGNLKILTPKECITARDSIEYWHKDNKGIARGQATALFPEKKGLIQADTLVAYFKPSSEKTTESKEKLSIDKVETEGRDITAMTADGHVYMEASTDKAYGDHAHYDVALDRILLTGGNLKILTPKESITARDSIEYWRKDNKGIARGQATALFPEKEELIQADTLVAYFKPSTEKTTESKEKLSIDKVEAEGHMLASSSKSVVTGDRGIYSAKDHLVEVFNNVKVMQGENVIEGGYARHNLETDVAEMFTDPPHISHSGSKKRISGIIIPKDAKKMKEKEGASSDQASLNHKDGHFFPISAKKRFETRSQ